MAPPLNSLPPSRTTSLSGIGPVVLRELRAEARRPSSYWIRTIAAAALLVVSWGIITLSHVPPPQIGRHLFISINATLFISIWVMVPILAADCLARERREGTLGLLFLTPLSAASIVLGKSLIHGLRSLTLFLVSVPMLTIPFLLGGLNPNECLMAFTLDASSLLLALSAGILASSIATQWRNAIILAFLFSVASCYLFMALESVGPVSQKYFLNSLFNRLSLRHFISDFAILIQSVCGLDMLSTAQFGGRQFYSPYWRNYGPAPSAAGWIAYSWVLCAASAVAFAATLTLAAWQVKRSWREEPPSAGRRWVERTLLTPRFLKSFFRRSLGRTLARNPIGWLHQQSWQARLVKWGWCLAVIILECLFVTDSGLSDLWSGQYFIGTLLLLSIAFSAAGSFRRERETGALELLLVTPLREGQILWGRVRGVWGQFLPSVTILLIAWAFLRTDAPLFSRDQATRLTSLWAGPIFIASFLALPFIGLYFSLARQNIIGAWLATCVAWLSIPTMFFFFPVFLGPVSALTLIVLLPVVGAVLTFESLFKRASFAILASATSLFLILKYQVNGLILVAFLLQLWIPVCFGRLLLTKLKTRQFLQISPA